MKHKSSLFYVNRSVRRNPKTAIYLYYRKLRQVFSFNTLNKNFRILAVTILDGGRFVKIE